MESPAGEVYRSKAKNKGLVANIWAHDIAQRLKIRRKIMAKDAGLGELDVGTYPSNGAVNVVDNGGFWKGVAMAGLAAGGLGAVSGLFQLKPETAVTPPVYSPAIESQVRQSQEWELEIMSVDGEPVVKGIRRAEDKAR